MDQITVYGIHGEGKGLCLSCAEKIYGNSLEMYIDSGEIQTLSDKDRLTCINRGLLCDECLHWIFPPEKTEDPRWLEDPVPEECIRLLVPFADFLERFQVDVRNLRCISISY